MNALESEQALCDFYLIYLFPVPLPIHTYISISLYIQVFIFHIRILLMRKADLFLILFLWRIAYPAHFTLQTSLLFFLTFSYSFFLYFTKKSLKLLRRIGLFSEE